MTRYSKHFAAPTQQQPIPGKNMIVNAAGGYTFAVDDFMRLRRFLILGAEGGSFYAGERELTLANADALKRCIRADGIRTVQLIVDISDRGLAPKNDAAIFALAAATVQGDENTRRAAFAAVPKVCRIGTHLFHFVEAREALKGGWGRGMRTAVGNWYNRQDLVLQALKYQQRDGWSHRDLLRLSHPTAKDCQQASVFNAIVKKDWRQVSDSLAEGFIEIQAAESAAVAARTIRDYNLPREFVPTQFLNEPVVWDALLPHMPLGALVRNLGNLTKVGVIRPLSDGTKIVAKKLGDEQNIRRSRLHPFNILLAQKVYGLGRGIKGSSTWAPVPAVVSALEDAFYAAFDNVQPTGLKHLLAVDVSGSMGWSRPIMTPAEAAAAMAMVTVRTEPEHYVMGFATRFVDLGIKPNDSLQAVLKKTGAHVMGGTDTSVAFDWAIKNKIEVDVVVTYTDNETWAGKGHTVERLNQYRNIAQRPTRHAVVGFTATQNSIGDPGDWGSMDFVGMDASLPAALKAFVTEGKAAGDQTGDPELELTDEAA